jgi:hypothetical protein
MLLENIQLTAATVCPAFAHVESCICAVLKDLLMTSWFTSASDKMATSSKVRLHCSALLA